MMNIIEMTFERRNEIENILNDLKCNTNTLDCIHTAVAEGNSEMYEALGGALHLVTINLYEIYNNLKAATGINSKPENIKTANQNKQSLELYPLK